MRLISKWEAVSQEAMLEGSSRKMTANSVGQVGVVVVVGACLDHLFRYRLASGVEEEILSRNKQIAKNEDWARLRDAPCAEAPESGWGAFLRESSWS